jgi:hypothetical protein
MYDPISPPHYARAAEHPSGVECIEMTRHMPFCLGNAVKYLYRAGHKGSAAEDYRKAAWYLRKQAEDAWQLEECTAENALPELQAWRNKDTTGVLVHVVRAIITGQACDLTKAADRCEQLASEVTP